MRTFTMIFVFLVLSYDGFAQQWVKTSSDPDGAGITGTIVKRNGTIIVTTASWSSLQGFLGGVRRSTDGGQTWQNPIEAFNGRTLHLGRGGVIFTSCWEYPQDEAVYRSTDDGVNWMRLHSVPAGDNIFSIESKDSNNTIFIGTRNGIKKSTNAGANWSYINNGIPANSWVRDMAISTAGVIAAATTNGLFISTDDGGSWMSATGIPAGDTIVSVNFDSTGTGDCYEDNTLMVGSSWGNVYTSRRLDNYIIIEFNYLFADMPEVVKGGFDALTPDLWGVALFPRPTVGGGFFISDDKGSTWTEVNEGLPLEPKTSSYEYLRDGNFARLYMGIYLNTPNGAQLYVREFTVGIQQVSSQIPSGYSLGQNYPNPFNPSTKINFDIPKNGFVKLSIYNSRGQIVKTLVNGTLQPGSYDYTFDGAGLTSGVYFYKLQSENFSEIKKMMLVK
jgi:hypothetical protein